MKATVALVCIVMLVSCCQFSNCQFGGFQIPGLFGWTDYNSGPPIFPGFPIQYPVDGGPTQYVEPPAPTNSTDSDSTTTESTTPS